MKYIQRFARSLRTSAKHTSRVKEYGQPDYLFFLGVVLLSLFGILMVYDSSIAIAIRDFSNPYYYVSEQIRWLLLGSIAFVVFSKIDYHRWYSLAAPMLMVTIGLLVAVFLPGIGVKAYGAHRWITLGFAVIQPAEIAKLVLAIYLSAWLSAPEKGRYPAFLMLIGLTVGLVLIEPDMGTAMIIAAIAFLLYFFSGSPVRHLLYVLPFGLAGIGGLIFAVPYRLRRLMTFLDPDSDPLGASFQIKQVTLALGAGGWFGVGIGRSKQKFEYLPEANTDSIFAIIGEEFGFVGAVMVILMFLFVVWRGYRIAKYAPDQFGRLLALGISSWVGVQMCINIAAMVALIPLTGVPLPLISSGGSSLIILLSALGIVMNISRQQTKKY